MNHERRVPDAMAVSVMVLLCLTWGMGHVAIKLASHGIPAVLQAGIRSLIATACLMLWARMRGIPLFNADGTLGAGIAAGALFAAEFLFLFIGLGYTSASRMSVFLYLAPCLTAAGLAWFIPGERLNPLQSLGMVLAFFGIVVAFGEGFSAAESTWAGDLMGIVGAFCWAATTVVVRTTRLSNARAEKTLYYQLAVSGVMLTVLSPLMGERGIVVLDAVTVGSLLYQAVIISFASYLAWFWLMTRFLASRLSVFTFLSPLFGVLSGALVLDEPVSSLFIASALLVGAGLYLVNRPSS